MSAAFLSSNQLARGITKRRDFAIGKTMRTKKQESPREAQSGHSHLMPLSCLSCLLKAATAWVEGWTLS
eukprot:4441826-Amphidinium_carterae.1